MFLNILSCSSRGRAGRKAVWALPLLLFVVLVPNAVAGAGSSPPAFFGYGFVFAAQGKMCPNGSEPLDDAIYQKAGAVDGVVYCSFRAKSFLYPETCPSGFKEDGREVRTGESLRRCRAIVDSSAK